MIWALLSHLFYTNKKLKLYTDRYTNTYILHGPQLLYLWIFPREKLTAVLRGWVSLGLLRSRCQNKSGCEGDLRGETSVRNRGEKARGRQGNNSDYDQDLPSVKGGKEGGIGEDDPQTTTQFGENLSQITGETLSHSCPRVTPQASMAPLPYSVHAWKQPSGSVVWQWWMQSCGSWKGQSALLPAITLWRTDKPHRRHTQRTFFETSFVPAKNANSLSGPLFES